MKLFRIEKNTSNLELKKFKKGYYKIIVSNDDVIELEVFCKIDKKTSDYFYFKVGDKDLPAFQKLEGMKMGYFVVPEQPDMVVVELQPEKEIINFINKEENNMNQFGKEFNFSTKEEKTIDTESRLDALKGSKKDVQDLDVKAEEIQRSKERKAQEEQRAKEQAKRQKAKSVAKGVDIFFDVATDAAKNPTIKKYAKTTAKAVVAAGAAWLVYRGVKFIADKM